MNDVVLSLAVQGAVWMLKIAAPILLAALVVGLIMGVIQAATQINEASLSFVPKLIAIVVVLAIAGPWMLDSLVELVRGSFTGFKELIHSS
jgi:flagellar biosynthetic protein FliQ